MLRSQLDEDGTLTDEDTVAVVESAVLRIAFALTELKRLVFIGSAVDSVKVRGYCRPCGPLTSCSKLRR